MHAPRPTGKTTALRALAQALTAEGRYAALTFSCEAGSVRVLAGFAEANIVLPPRRWVTPEGRLDMRTLLDAFAAWWQEQGEALAPKMPYHEVAAQLVLSAWLERVVDGGGFIVREYGVGRRRIDVLVRWPLPGGSWQRGGAADPTPEGLAQLEAWLSSLNLDHGWVVVFDRRTDAAPVGRADPLRRVGPARDLQVSILHV